MRLTALKTTAFALALGATAGLLSAGAEAQTRLTLKSASSTSSYYVMMVQLAEMLEDATDGEIQPTVEESQGSVQNVKEAARRPGAFLFTTPPSLLETARAGEGDFEGEEGYERIRTLFAVPFITIHFVVSEDSGIENVEDLAGTNFIPGGTGTFCEGRTKAVLGLLGLGEEMEFSNVELNNAPDALRNGRVDGYATCSSHPVPGLVELATTTDVTVLSFTDEQREKIFAEDPLSGPITIAAGTYDGQDEPVNTVAVPVGAFGTTDMDDETAYQVVKTFWQQRDRLAEENPWWEGVTPDLVAQMGTPIHPGALRYYEEAGIEIPESMR